MSSSSIPPSNANINALKCTAPGFIQKFFASSRLHHLSNWKADLAEYVADYMAQSKHFHHPSSANHPNRVIMHIDMDCFFASVGIRDRPNLKGKPVAVAHSVGGMKLDHSSSEIASCNYEARARGIKNGMFLGSAKQLASDLIIIPYEFEKYDACSKALYRILIDHSDYVQAVSCDEAYIDVTFLLQNQIAEQHPLTLPQQVMPAGQQQQHHSQGHNKRQVYEEDDEANDNDADSILAHNNAQQQSHNNKKKNNKKNNTITTTLQSSSSFTSSTSSSSSSTLLLQQYASQHASLLRSLILQATQGCPASVGISYNLLLARIATMQAKPDNLYGIFTAQHAQEYLQTFSIKNLPGIGWSISEKCQLSGFITCGDIMMNQPKNSLALLQKLLGGKTGETVYSYAHGRDDRLLENKYRQSLGCEINWGIRFTTQMEVESFLKEVCQEVISRLQKGCNSSSYSNPIVSYGQIIVNAKKKLYEGEPAKFLGHGHCLDLSKSIQLATAASFQSSYSSSSGSSNSINDVVEVLYRHVISLFKEFQLIPEEIRGIGVHVKKLKRLQQQQHSKVHDPYSPNHIGQRQTMLNFAKAATASSLAATNPTQQQSANQPQQKEEIDSHQDNCTAYEEDADNVVALGLGEDNEESENDFIRLDEEEINEKAAISTAAIGDHQHEVVNIVDDEEDIIFAQDDTIMVARESIDGQSAIKSQPSSAVAVVTSDQQLATGSSHDSLTNKEDKAAKIREDRLRAYFHAPAKTTQLSSNEKAPSVSVALKPIKGFFTATAMKKGEARPVATPEAVDDDLAAMNGIDPAVWETLPDDIKREQLTILRMNSQYNSKIGSSDSNKKRKL